MINYNIYLFHIHKNLLKNKLIKYYLFPPSPVLDPNLLVIEYQFYLILNDSEILTSFLSISYKVLNTLGA
jgi:hypothetical protein